MRDNRFSVVDFDGADDFINVADSSSLDIGTSDMTISAWVNFNDTATTQYIVNKMYSSVGYYFRLQSNETLHFNINDGSNEYYISTSLPATITFGTWHHVAVTWNSTTNKALLYIDSVTTTSGEQNNTIGDVSNSGALRIGMNTDALNLEFNGSMSSVSIYNTAKSAEEIYAIYQQGITYDESSLSGLVGYWRMGDDTSKAYPTIADSSSNSNDGTITNGASDDIVQQMVAGYDMGAFESIEELNGDLVTNGDMSNLADAGSNGYAFIPSSGWSFKHSGSSGGESTQFSQSDNGALRIFSNKEGISYYTVGAKVSVTTGTLYKLTFDAKTNDASKTNLGVRYSNGNNMFYGNNGLDVGATLTTSFQTFTYYFVPDADSNGGRAVHFGRTDGVSVGHTISVDATIDNVSVKEVLQSADLSDTHPAIIDVNEPVLGVEINTVANATSPTNETNATTGWESGVFASTISSVAEGYTGSYSLKVVTSINLGFAQTSSAWTVDNDSIYKLSITWKTEGTNTNEWQYGWGTTQTNGSYGIEVEDGSTDWVTSVKYIKTTSTSLHLYLQEKESTSNALALYVDSISIKKVQGNVGTMTNQDSADLVYSSVLPDQSFLTGVNSAYNLISLDGSNEYIDCGTGIGNFLGDNYAGDLSISIWFKSAGFGNDGLFNIGDFSSTNGEITILIYNNELGCHLNNIGWRVKVTSFSDTSWNHLFCVYKSGSESDTNMYLNGSSVGSKSGTFPSASDIDLNGLKTIIGAYSSASTPFNGDMGQVAIWNKELSSDVGSIYNAGRHTNLLDSYSDNLKGYWAMSALDASTGLSDVGNGTIYDRSGNSNHGTATNTESADLASSPNAEPNGYAKGDTNRSTTIP